MCSLLMYLKCTIFVDGEKYIRKYIYFIYIFYIYFKKYILQDQFWAQQEVMFDWTADLTGTGDRSEYTVESISYN